MFKIDTNLYEAEAGESIHNFAEKLMCKYKECRTDIIGIFNDIDLRVNQYENPMSLYWQYMYKNQIRKF